MPGGRGRGGRRSGTPGKAYANRSDLAGKAPISAAPGQGYGERKAQEDAQRAVPMGTPEIAPEAAFTGRPAGMPPPGAMGDLFADSTRPDEDVMNGAALGPGLGPDAFGTYGQDAARQDSQQLAKYLPALEEIANRPGSSSAMRHLVRSLKGAI